MLYSPDFSLETVLCPLPLKGDDITAQGFAASAKFPPYSPSEGYSILRLQKRSANLLLYIRLLLLDLPCM